VGGRDDRAVPVTGGSALVSVALRRKRDGHRIYAYLRWSDQGQTVRCHRIGGSGRLLTWDVSV